MSAHTKEPWILRHMSYGFDLATPGIEGGYGGWFIELHGGGDEIEIQSEFEANARRIVACVNACEGISTDLLEQRPVLNSGQISPSS